MPRPFKVPVGTKLFIAMCVPSLIIIFIAFFINGTDYFVGGMAALVSGPAMYYIFKTRCGGLTKTDPANYPVNPKTGLGIGDTKRMAWMFAVLTFIGLLASFFLPWYEDPVAYAHEYGVEGLFEFLISCIRWLTLASAGLTVILAIVASRLEPKREGVTATA